ncbi:MAG: hypothetical protein ACKN9T_04855, partial [Candidatus Methylumidiphilus sp.]
MQFLMKALPLLAASALFVSTAPQAAPSSAAISAELPQARQSSCLRREQAEVEAETLARQSAQTYCRSNGYGWRAASVKQFGRLDCQRCGDGGQVSCGYAHIALECRKAEP